jgi:hypothetical protein
VITAAVCLSSILVTFCTWHTAWPPPTAAAALFLLQTLAHNSAAELRIGGQRWILSLDGAACCLCLYFLPGAWVPLVVAAGVLVSELFIRRPLQKLIFNVATLASAAACGVGIFNLFPHDQIGVWPALLSAAVVYSIFSQVAVSFVVGAVRNVPWHSIFRDGAPVAALTIAGDWAISSVVILLARYSPVTLALVPPVVLCLIAVYRHSMRTKVESALWENLDQVDLAGAQLDESEVIGKATSAARDLFHADTAELIFDAPDDEAAPGIVVEPVPGPDGQLGVLRMTLDGTAELTNVERRVLVRFAHGIGSAVINARLHGETRELAERNAYQATHDDLTGLANRPAR